MQDIANDATSVAQAELKQFVERIERLNEEKKATLEDIKEVYAESKARGFDNKAIRKIISLRAIDPEKRDEEEAMLNLYMDALGMA
ncbi:DNA-binding protein [Ochrobactrum phage vB_OspM_OC]|nr:DNA-binding protein [Ochrobactrum phage vB_OspM_OC]